MICQVIYLNYVRAIDDTQKAELETDLTEQEILESIHSFSKNKSPGPDGLTAEFYQKFSRELAPLFRKVVEEIFERGEMPNHMNLSYITLLPKEENCRQTKQYRPWPTFSLETPKLKMDEVFGFTFVHAPLLVYFSPSCPKLS